jgi:ADP-ribose pyrophosphatase
MHLRAIEIVEDRTAASRCDEGFLKLARLSVRNLYDDGSASAPYACDVLSRPGSDAVVAVLYEVTADGRVQVLLREAPRVPIYLRKDKRFVHPDPREYLSLLEVVAGMVEADDPPGAPGLRRRAAREAEEEAGLAVPEERFAVTGGETFASPGTTDEKLYFAAAPAPLGDARGGAGDGSTMEEWGRIATFELGAAIEACRDGRVPDMKTEVALLRLADHLGYVPQLGCFACDLPAELAAQLRPLGVQRRDAR